MHRWIFWFIADESGFLSSQDAVHITGVNRVGRKLVRDYRATRDFLVRIVREVPRFSDSAHRRIRFDDCESEESNILGFIAKR